MYAANSQDHPSPASRAAECQRQHLAVKSVIEVRKADVEKADALFVGTWVQGFILFGVKPAGAELWVSALPFVERKPVGVFCTYAINPRNSLQALSALLEARGTHIVGHCAFHRSRAVTV